MKFLFDTDTWQEIFQTLSKNKLRTVLAGVTIAFAILLFTLLFGIGNGLKNSFAKSFNDDANNSIFIRVGQTTKPYKGLQSGRKIQFKNDDYSFLINEFGEKVQFISARIYKNVKAIYQNQQNNYTLRAVHPDHQFLEKTMVDEGRYFNMFDLKKKSKVIVIGRLVKEDLFGNKRALDKSISLNGVTYKVIGVFSDEGGDNEERMIYMPITTAQSIYGNNDYIDQLNLTYNPELNLEQAISFGNIILSKFKEKHGIAPRDQGALRVSNMAEANKGVGQFMMVLNVIILFIGIGTLIAGIIGISNIMVYIVRERTKEIGIRKAIGATPNSIIGMIMLESIFVTAIAGYSGLLIGMFTLKALGKSLEDYFILNPSVETYVVVGATIILIMAGTIAGYIPAKRASSIKPIVALNDE